MKYRMPQWSRLERGGVTFDLTELDEAEVGAAMEPPRKRRSDLTRIKAPKTRENSRNGAASKEAE